MENEIRGFMVHVYRSNLLLLMITWLCLPRCTVVCYLVNHCCAYGKRCELFPNSVSSCYIEIVFIKHLCYRAIMRFGHFYLGMKKMPVLIKYFL